jgi:hypothetical protein
MALYPEILSALFRVRVLSDNAWQCRFVCDSANFRCRLLPVTAKW